MSDDIAITDRRDERIIEILLVEDNPGDVYLTLEAFRSGKIRNKINVAQDGEEALDYLYQRGQFIDAVRPDLILLDLNLPKKDGREVLDGIKTDRSLRAIPVIVLTTSKAEEDIVRCYDLHCNAYITKPVSMEQFIGAVAALSGFWFEVVKYPAHRR